MKKLLVGVCLCGMLMTGCAQSMAKSYGGTTTIELEPGQKLELITWKNDSLWILTREMRDGESAEKHTYHESDPMGLLEGTVYIIEKSEENSDEPSRETKES